MKSVFLIKSPLQLLNAIEAKHYFNLNREDCILIVMGDRKSQPQIMKLVHRKVEWGDVIILNHVNLFFGSPLENNSGLSFFKRFWQSKRLRKSYFYVRRLNRISRYLIRVENIFIGYASSIYMRHFLNNTPHENTFLLDDGNATIKIARERKNGIARLTDVGWEKKIKLFAKKYFQGIKTEQPKSLTFFTIYGVALNDSDNAVHHNFNYIRSNALAPDTTEDVYFLGSPLSRVGIISEAGYLKHLQRVKDYYAGKKMVYIAHRREMPQSLKEISEKLSIEVLLLEYPIEAQFAMIGPRPKILASFISSALDNCRLIFADKMEINSFKLDLEDGPRREDVVQVYKGYEASASESFVVVSEY